MKLIDQHITELKKLCDRYHVSELYVFGSVAKDQFTDKSDIDFLVRFSGVDPLEYFDNYMDFKGKLSELFSREIDLVEIQTIKNPILKRSIYRDKIILYGREDSKVAV
jgi:hypothetical protein